MAVWGHRQIPIVSRKWIAVFRSAPRLSVQIGTSLTTDTAMTTSPTLQSERGVTLIETAIAIGVMGVGALGSVGVLAQGVQKTNTGPGST
jgi:hypothetical protein